MIYYLATADKFSTLGVQLVYLNPDLQRLIRLVSYDDVHLLTGIENGVVIWSDLDRLDEQQRLAAEAMEQHLRGKFPRICQLNSPRQSLRRFELLKKLYIDQMNSFDVFRLDQPVSRFPVFVRHEIGYAATAPSLVNSSTELSEAIQLSKTEGGDDWMIVEFKAQPSTDGRYRKYGAFRVGDRIFAQHCIVSSDWFIKTVDRFELPSDRSEHLEYFRNNPHTGYLRRVFELAAIDYGRVDYGIVEGKIQIFEINTNPTIIGAPPSPFEIDQSAYAVDHALALQALPGALDDDRAISGAAAIFQASERHLGNIRRAQKRKRRHLILQGARRTALNIVRRGTAVLPFGGRQT